MSSDEAPSRKRPVDSDGEENEDSDEGWVGPRPTSNDDENSASQDDSNGFGVDINLREDVPEEKPETAQVKKRKSKFYYSKTIDNYSKNLIFYILIPKR
jgi:hypothetical protein